MTLHLRVGSEITLYLLIGSGERVENWDLRISFHGLSNGITHSKIKRFVCRPLLNLAGFFMDSMLNCMEQILYEVLIMTNKSIE